jgi:hypothetical protein
LIRKKGHWEAQIIELGGPNYAKVGAKMMNLEGNKVDVPCATWKGPNYRYFGLQNSSPTSKSYSISPPRPRYDIYKKMTQVIMATRMMRMYLGEIQVAHGNYESGTSLKRGIEE